MDKVWDDHDNGGAPAMMAMTMKVMIIMTATWLQQQKLYSAV